MPIEYLLLELERTLGGVAGYSTGTIIDSNIRGEVNSSANNTGGLVGRTDNVVSNCTAEVNIEGNTNSGGLIGYYYVPCKNITVSNCNTKGNITGTDNTGGIIGHFNNYNWSSGSYSSLIESCFSDTNVKGNNYCGGIVGYMTVVHISGLYRKYKTKY